MKSVLITGANRGLGLEFARQYRADGWQVITCCRNMSRAGVLADYDVDVVGLDVSDADAIGRMATDFAGHKIDLLINNAGMMGDAGCSALDADLNEWRIAINVNMLAPALLTRALLPNLALSNRPVGATLGSLSGLFANMTSGELAIYRSTKAAAHAVTISLGHALRSAGVTYIGLRPGRTRTDMTGGKGDYTAQDSVAMMRKVLAQITPQDASKFIDRLGVICSYEDGKCI